MKALNSRHESNKKTLTINRVQRNKNCR